MKIMFLKMTFFGKSVLPGDILEVNEADGKRLVTKGIAKKVVEEESASYEADEATDEEQPDEMSTKEMFELCKEKGFVLDKKMINGRTDKEKREYLLSVINSAEG